MILSEAVSWEREDTAAPHCVQMQGSPVASKGSFARAPRHSTRLLLLLCRTFTIFSSFGLGDMAADERSSLDWSPPPGVAPDDLWKRFPKNFFFLDFPEK